MKHLKPFNNLNFKIEEGNSPKIKMYDGDKWVGYSVVAIKDNVFDGWNKRLDLEVEPIENKKSLHIIGISMEERRSGYGSKLISYIEEYAKNNNCDYITLSALTEALGFWKKMGYYVYSMDGYFSMYKKI